MGKFLQMWLSAALFGTGLLLASCATEEKRAESEIADIVAWLPGHYDNIEQSQEDARAGRTPHVALAVTIVPIDIPTFGDHVFYLQESVADDPRRVTTQRLLSFYTDAEQHVLEATYTLGEPARWRDAHLNPDVFKGMMYKDATPLTGCELLWKKETARFVAVSPSGQCRATIPSLGGGVKLLRRAELSADEWFTSELAYNSAGVLIQGDATDPFYRFRKRSGL